MSIITLSLIQNEASASREDNIHDAIEGIRSAAAQGAQIICLQELFASLYFAQIQDTAHFDLAEPLPGPSIEALTPLAEELEIVIIVPVFEKAQGSLYFNSVGVIDADGSYLGKYRKTHIPQDPCFEEKFYFAPGDLGFPVFKTKYATIAALICWDQWFPEAARLVALQGADIIFYPTAIGWLPGENEGDPQNYLQAWQSVQRGHAAANSCYVAACNRVGQENQINFWGNSFICDYQGRILKQAGQSNPEILIQNVDIGALEAHRRTWPFLRDRRTDAYSGLSKLS